MIFAVVGTRPEVIKMAPVIAALRKTEEIMGKTCDKYTMDDPALKMKSTYSVWNGIPLKSEIDMAGVKATVTTTKIEENASIPAEKFEIPAYKVFSNKEL